MQHDFFLWIKVLGMIKCHVMATTKSIYDF